MILTGHCIEVMRTLQQLRDKRAITIVLITHEPDIAAYGTRIIAVRDGLIRSDTPNQPRSAVDDEPPADPVAAVA